ncbi:hypothetical protein OH76DRAFT_510744 [Lentinus brumalis]|uniref:Uncharacterized protein n=1 Tax=Lentinus brumalis TaxID=2498619 RepID=A0A371DB40_9APHY|nr:hypothetical protein OH76DRAFT_510744 [Polyporus brumalis]
MSFKLYQVSVEGRPADGKMHAEVLVEAQGACISVRYHQKLSPKERMPKLWPGVCMAIQRCMRWTYDTSPRVALTLALNERVYLVYQPLAMVVHLTRDPARMRDAGPILQSPQQDSSTTLHITNKTTISRTPEIQRNINVSLPPVLCMSICAQCALWRRWIFLSPAYAPARLHRVSARAARRVMSSGVACEQRK